MILSSFSDDELKKIKVEFDCYINICSEDCTHHDVVLTKSEFPSFSIKTFLKTDTIVFFNEDKKGS